MHPIAQCRFCPQCATPVLAAVIEYEGKVLFSPELVDYRMLEPVAVKRWSAARAASWPMGFGRAT